MLILRIEDSEGVGCYSTRNPSSGRLRIPAFRAHAMGGCEFDYRVHHPGPENDLALSTAWNDIQDGLHGRIGSGNSRFGFLNPKQYHAWFYTERARRILHECGMRASVYAVPNQYIEIGHTQVIYSKTWANLVTIFQTDDPIEEMESYWTNHDHPQRPVDPYNFPV